LFWIISFLLWLLAAAFVLVPVWRQRNAVADTTDSEAEKLRRGANITIFEERRQELDAELKAGVIGQSQYDGLLLELKRSLLADLDSEKTAAGQPGPGSRWSQWVPVAMLVLLLAMAYPLYSLWGHLDDVAPMDLYEQTFNNTDNDPEVARQLAIALGGVVQQDTDNAWAWYFLARNFSTLGRFNEAEIAFQQSIGYMEEGPDKAAVIGQYAQIKYIVSGGELTGEVMALVDQARAINANEISVLQLLSIDAELKEDYPRAIEYWRLLIQANPNSQEAQRLRQNIASAQQLIAERNGETAATGPRIEVHLALADGLELPADLRVFVAARNASQEGAPPLAATELRVGDLPAVVNLDNSSAMVPAFNLASADTIYISATVSRTGSANVQSGDYRVVSENFAHNGQHSVIDLVISEPVP
jgi:cytochrome c-type biogenesis protein CcmH